MYKFKIADFFDSKQKFVQKNRGFATFYEVLQQPLFQRGDFMKFQVGYQDNRRFLEYLLAHTEQIAEIYFPWKDFTTGRGISDVQEQLESDLSDLAAGGLKFCLLLNGNCYGKQALAADFFEHLAKNVSEISSRYGLNSVTTASPVIAAFLKKHFPQLHIRASVNMEIGTPEAVEYLADDFDGFYLKREYNYDLERIKRMRDFCRSCGKKLYILANSGCLNFCSARTFHDNLVAHQHEIVQQKNSETFCGLCTQYLKRGNNARNILGKSNFLRPEDVIHYEELCDGMKLATRTNFNPMAIAHAYFNGKFNGNLLDLTEPAHSALLPGRIVANKLIPADYLQHRFACNKVCEKCTYCQEVQERATIIL